MFGGSLLAASVCLSFPCKMLSDRMCSRSSIIPVVLFIFVRRGVPFPREKDHAYP